MSKPATVIVPAESEPPNLFDKGSYQALYMTDRREADRLGFGGSKATNPNYLTVAEYRARKKAQDV